jgi:hypothetical protein
MRFVNRLRSPYFRSHRELTEYEYDDDCGDTSAIQNTNRLREERQYARFAGTASLIDSDSEPSADTDDQISLQQIDHAKQWLSTSSAAGSRQTSTQGHGPSETSAIELVLEVPKWKKPSHFESPTAKDVASGAKSTVSQATTTQTTVDTMSSSVECATVKAFEKRYRDPLHVSPDENVLRSNRKSIRQRIICGFTPQMQRQHQASHAPVARMSPKRPITTNEKSSLDDANNEKGNQSCLPVPLRKLRLSRHETNETKGDCAQVLSSLQPHNEGLPSKETISDDIYDGPLAEKFALTSQLEPHDMVMNDDTISNKRDTQQLIASPSAPSSMIQLDHHHPSSLSDLSLLSSAFESRKPNETPRSIAKTKNRRSLSTVSQAESVDPLDPASLTEVQQALRQMEENLRNAARAGRYVSKDHVLKSLYEVAGRLESSVTRKNVHRELSRMLVDEPLDDFVPNYGEDDIKYCAMNVSDQNELPHIYLTTKSSRVSDYEIKENYSGASNDEDESWQPPSTIDTFETSFFNQSSAADSGGTTHIIGTGSEESKLSEKAVQRDAFDITDWVAELERHTRETKNEAMASGMDEIDDEEECTETSEYETSGTSSHYDSRSGETGIDDFVSDLFSGIGDFFTFASFSGDDDNSSSKTRKRKKKKPIANDQLCAPPSDHETETTTEHYQRSGRRFIGVKDKTFNGDTSEKKLSETAESDSDTHQATISGSLPLPLDDKHRKRQSKQKRGNPKSVFRQRNRHQSNFSEEKEKTSVTSDRKSLSSVESLRGKRKTSNVLPHVNRSELDMDTYKMIYVRTPAASEGTGKHYLLDGKN